MPPAVFLNGNRFSFVLDIDTTSPIAVLLLPRCPPEVLGAITAIIVYAINHPAIRARANVLKKGLKTLPAITNKDASAPIVFEGLVVWV